MHTIVFGLIISKTRILNVTRVHYVNLVNQINESWDDGPRCDHGPHTLAVAKRLRHACLVNTWLEPTATHLASALLSSRPKTRRWTPRPYFMQIHLTSWYTIRIVDRTFYYEEPSTRTPTLGDEITYLDLQCFFFFLQKSMKKWCVSLPEDMAGSTFRPISQVVLKYVLFLLLYNIRPPFFWPHLNNTYTPSLHSLMR